MAHPSTVRVSNEVQRLEGQLIEMWQGPQGSLGPKATKNFRMRHLRILPSGGHRLSAKSNRVARTFEAFYGIVPLSLLGQCWRLVGITCSAHNACLVLKLFGVMHAFCKAQTTSCREGNCDLFVAL
eukprot:1105243-Amphidinium_carterae.1